MSAAPAPAPRDPFPAGAAFSRTTRGLALGLLALAALAQPAGADPQPCAGVVPGDQGLVVDAGWGLYAQASVPGGPTAYAGYSEHCEGRPLVDLG